VTAVPIESLRYRNRFVESLPGDPVQTTRSRQVEGACFSRTLPTPVRCPRLLALVPEVADLLGLAREPTPLVAEVLGGNRVLPEMAPYAACYGGHQFGNWAGQLGDGRALTLAEVEGPDGAWEIQLKGAGPTPYSRHADGRAVLRSSIRELVCSEAMFHLGVPTTRALSLVDTGDVVVRDMFYDGNPRPEPGAIVCRVAPSFLRFGNYQIHAARGDVDVLRELVRFTIRTLYPEIEGDLPVGAFFAEVCERTARMVVEWMRVGFVHGVMNTDNMSILGLTIDYGPYGWIDDYDPDWTPNTTDAGGRRYRFGHQPRVALWNLVQLARALAPLVSDPAELEASIQRTAKRLDELSREMMLGKLGLDPARGEPDEDDAILAGLVEVLTLAETDMTLFFRGLAELSVDPACAAHGTALFSTLRPAYYHPERVPSADAARVEAWLARWLARAAGEADRAEIGRAHV